MEWKTVKLGDVCSILGDGIHGTPMYDAHGTFYFINGNNLDNGHIVLKADTKKVDKNEYLKHKKDLTNRTILISINGTLGNTAKYNGEPCILGKSACYFNVLPEYDIDFIYYIVANSKFKADLEQMATGTTIKNVSLKSLREYEIAIPTGFDDQHRIAAILSSLDDKIENNNRINANLEAQAQALFKSWFVDYEPFGGVMPEDWEEYELGEFLPVITGKKDANIASKTGKYPFFSCAQDILYTENYSFNADAILVAGNGDFNVKWYRGKFEAYQRTYVLIPNDSRYLGWLFYMVKHNLSNITCGARGSVIKFITKGNLENFRFAAPKDLTKCDIIDKFNVINQTIESKKAESQRLAALRDTLLPKLMKGEIAL